MAGTTYGSFKNSGSPAAATATAIGPVVGASNLYVMKIAPSTPLAPNTPSLIYLTGVGSSGLDALSAMTVGRDGSVYLAGTTTGKDFPTTAGCFQPASATGGGFLLKLDSSGKGLAYSTYLDRPGTIVYALAIDDQGTAYIGGATYSNTFPTTPGAYRRSFVTQPFANSTYTAGFVSKFDASGALIASTLLSGPVLDGSVAVYGIAVNSDGTILASGSPGGAAGFPTTPGAPYETASAIGGSGFLARLSSTASALLYSTYLDAGSTLKLDSSGNAYVSGSHLVKVDPQGRIVYHTPIVSGRPLVVRSDGTAVVTGNTYVPSFPTKDTLEPCWPNSPQALPSVFTSQDISNGTLTAVDASGNATLSTLLGGNIEAIALDPTGMLYVIGSSATNTFPPAPVFDKSDGYDFGFKLDLTAVQHGGPAPACLVNAATMTYAPAAAGTLATLFGSGMGPEAGAEFRLDANGQVPTELGGTTVTVGGIAAPILYAADSQVNFVVPRRLSGSTTNVCVTRAGIESCIFAYTAPISPGIFCNYICDVFHGFAILNSDGTLNAPWNPAARGSVIALFGTGMGPFDRDLADGSVAGPPLANLANPVQAIFQGDNPCTHMSNPGCSEPVPTYPAAVLFAGAAPEQVAGVDQIDVRIPADTPPVPGAWLVLTQPGPAGFALSVTVAVK